MNVWLVLLFRGNFDILDEIVFYLSFRNLGNALVDAEVFAVCASGCNDSFDISGAFYTIGKVFVSFGNVRLLAGIAAIVTALLTKSILFTILAGILTMMLFNFLV